MTKKLTMQQIILTLQQYWSAQGCMLMQAYDTEKGAGTMSLIRSCAPLAPSHGTRPTWNLHGGLLMAGTLKTPTGCINITSSKL